LKGRVLPFPVLGKVRPTTERTRTAFFDRIGPKLKRNDFLDGYAGSGIMGIEALSRGAGCAIFLESNQKICDQLIKNLKYFKLESQSFVLTGDVEENILKAVKKASKRIVGYFDPPYDTGPLSPIFEQLMINNITDIVEFIAVEHHHKSNLLAGLQNWTEMSRMRYGETIFTYLVPDSIIQQEVNK
jgi:16S rRNA (guanine966-N2)-methyltransferase